MSTIIFGTKRLGKEDGSTGVYQKYEDKAVVTLEGIRGHGKSRRFLFNKLAADKLGLENGAVQHVIFGTMVSEESKTVLLGNSNNIADSEGLTLYKTSKNAVAYDNSKEKGKAISSSVITGDISSFLGLDDSIDHEFILADFDSEDIEACLLEPLVEDTEAVEELDEKETETITEDSESLASILSEVSLPSQTESQENPLDIVSIASDFSSVTTEVQQDLGISRRSFDATI